MGNGEVDLGEVVDRIVAGEGQVAAVAEISENEREGSLAWE